jgi:uncharacterized membrane protein YqjE
MDKNTSLQELGLAWLGLFKDQAKLISLESRLAQISMIPLLISGLALALFSISVWFLGLAVLGAWIYNQGYALLPTLSIVFGANLVMMIFAYFSLCKYKKRMEFRRTRQSLRELI